MLLRCIYTVLARLLVNVISYPYDKTNTFKNLSQFDLSNFLKHFFQLKMFKKNVDLNGSLNCVQRGVDVSETCSDLTEYIGRLCIKLKAKFAGFYLKKFYSD